MASTQPRPPYSERELAQLFPKELELAQVQIILRHGERAPTSPRFQNAGLPLNWPYCSAAKRFKAIVMSSTDGSEWDDVGYRRRMENFGLGNVPVYSKGPGGEVDNICEYGELTDKGRETTLALGQRLRHLYVSQLGFMPQTLTSSTSIYLRASPYVRAQESLMQSFYGMYPRATRDSAMAPPILHLRSIPNEIMFDNSGNCKRLRVISKAFSQRAMDRWNGSDEFDYVTKKLGKWMPESCPEVRIDGKPSSLGIMDTTNATLAHGPATRLPKEFYDEKIRAIIDRAAVDEWFSGYADSLECRRLGWGPLAGDIAGRMISVVRHDANSEVGDAAVDSPPPRLSMSGGHDTTIAGLLTSLGAFDGEKWPPFTSHLAIELFKRKPEYRNNASPSPAVPTEPSSGLDTRAPAAPRTSWFASLFNFGRNDNPTPTQDGPVARKHIDKYDAHERAQLEDYYVRIRYNDRPVTIPGCRVAGRHLEREDGHGDETFCTLAAFKGVVDAFTPRDWKRECGEGLDQPFSVPKTKEDTEPAGYIPGDLRKREL